MATFIGRALTFETPISDQKLVWSQKYGDLLEAKGKDSMQFEIRKSQIESNIVSYITIESVQEAVHIIQSIYDEYETKPLLDTILSPYSRDNHSLFKLSTIASFVQGDKPPC